ncbi:MAG: rod-binding protein [Rhizobiaceae bacterium]|nr:rod-binding protein [Rhizobiaceae bacterium]
MASAKSASELVTSVEDSFSALVSSGNIKKDIETIKTATFKEGASAKAMEKFEAMVVSQLFGTMLKAMPGDSFGAGMSGDIYKSMFADALGEQIAKHGGLGIAGLGQYTNASRLDK